MLFRSRVQHFRANVDRLTFRYDAVGPAGTEWVYLIRRGTVRAELPVPSSEDARLSLDALATRIFDGPDPSGSDIPTHDLDEFYLVASWFRRREAERARVRPPKTANTNGELPERKRQGTTGN